MGIRHDSQLHVDELERMTNPLFAWQTSCLQTKLTKALHRQPNYQLYVASRANLSEESLTEGTAVNGDRLGTPDSLGLPSTLNL